MSLWNKDELLQAFANKYLQYNLADDLQIAEVIIDSRKITNNGLFVALKGDNNDGHDFLNQAIENGCKCLIIDNAKALEKISTTSEISFILVKNTFDALYDLAKYSRKRSNARIIAVTGSVGKTTTKEMLKLAFSSIGKTYATVGNLNNHIGLPLSLCNFAQDCDYGIFEMGMNHANEIAPLSQLAQPHLAIITNVGAAHIENFGSEEKIAEAKAEIFSGILQNSSLALINGDNKHYEFLKKCAANYQVKNLYNFGKASYNSYRITNEKTINYNLSEIATVSKNGENITYEISSCNQAIIDNSLIVLSSLDLLVSKTQRDQALKSLKNFTIGSGRGKISEIKIANKNILIIDDTYNANILSISAGLQHAQKLKLALSKKRLIVAIGDMLELGEKSSQLHQDLGAIFTKCQVDFALLVGNEVKFLAAKLDKNYYDIFTTSEELASQIFAFLQDGDILFVKGSRGIRMEKIVNKLLG